MFVIVVLWVRKLGFCFIKVQNLGEQVYFVFQMFYKIFEEYGLIIVFECWNYVFQV